MCVSLCQPSGGVGKDNTKKKFLQRKEVLQRRRRRRRRRLRRRERGRRAEGYRKTRRRRRRKTSLTPQSLSAIFTSDAQTSGPCKGHEK